MVGGKMSEKNLEQRININLCVKIGKSASEMWVLLEVAYGEYTMKKLRQIKEGREDVQDDPTSGLPKMQRTNANVDRLTFWSRNFTFKF